jgi:putative DNA primase/helicase
MGNHPWTSRQRPRVFCEDFNLNTTTLALSIQSLESTAGDFDPNALTPLETALWLLGEGLWPIILETAKAPGRKGWGLTRPTEESLRIQAVKAGEHAGVGLLVGIDGRVIDIEVDDRSKAEATLAAMFPHGVPSTLSWTSNRGGHWLFKYDERLARYGKTKLEFGGVEVRIGTFDASDKRQVQCTVPPTTRSDGSPRQWIGSQILALPESVLTELDRRFPIPTAGLTRSGPTVGILGVDDTPRHGPVDMEEVASALAAIPVPAAYELWLDVGLALSTLPDNEGGFRLWDEWSAKGEGYTGTHELEKKWASFNGSGIGIGTLFHRAKEAGWKPPAKPTVTSGDGTATEVYESVDDSFRLARIFIKERCRHDGTLTQRFWNGDFWRWDGTAYRPVAEPELKAELARIAKMEFDRANAEAVGIWERNGGKGANGHVIARPQCHRVSNVLLGNVTTALSSLTLATMRDVPAQPAWLDGDAPWPAIEALPCANGIVRVPTGGLEPLSPRFFNSWSVPYRFDPDAPDPDLWTQFLATLWPDDSESVDTLQQWFGYCLTSDTRQQKMVALIGPKRSGKGTVARVLSATLGHENCAGPTLAGIGSQFGLEALIGKPVAIISDARLSGRSDQAVVTERLLSITGEDTLTIDRKHRLSWTGKLPTRFLLLSNELPRLTDASGALASRVILLRLVESFFGREDHDLSTRLLSQLPGILNWSLEGLSCLRKRGRFVQPKSGRELIEEMENLASPVGAFIRDECEVGAGFSVSVSHLFTCWKLWCQGKGRDAVGTEQTFGRDVRAVLPKIRVIQPRVNGKQVRTYEGVRLRPSGTLIPRDHGLFD